MNSRTFAKTIEIEGASFLVRGLTIEEYCGLFMSDAFKNVRNSFFIKIALRCCIDWWDVPQSKNGEPVYDDRGRQQFEPFSEEMVQELPENILAQIGQFAWEKLTSISEKEEEWFKAYVRFADFLSDDDYKSESKYYSCKTCVEANKHLTKPCGKDDEEIRRLKGGDADDGEFLDEPDIEKQINREDRTKSLIEKMKTRRKQKSMSSPTERKKERQKRSNGLTLKKYSYPECPVSWIPDWVRVIGDKMLYCEKHNTNFFSGGLADQLKKLYDISRITSNEIAVIERERFEENRPKKGKHR